MTHYSIERWADFVRGLTPDPEREGMERHLSGGCGSCLSLVTLLRGVVETAANDIDVPAAVLADAAAIFAPRRERGASRWAKLVAVLVFDSDAALAPAGVRSAGGGARRLAFSSEDFAVELLVDVTGPQRTVAITGQISAPGKPAEASALAVLLMSGRQVFERTLTNEAGEFHLEFPTRAQLRLCIRDEVRRREIEVPLGPMTGLGELNNKKK
jgi:hypothetical protein